MAKTLSAHEESVARILSDEYVFRIPGYQRPYAWTTEQARELYDDLSGFMNIKLADIEEMPPYFLGSVVLIKNESNPNSDVVDGQQRLTTLTLLLAAIRSSVSADNAGYLTPFLYEKGNPIRGTQDRFRLTLRDRDREFFQRYVQRENGIDDLVSLDVELSDSQRNLKDNARLYVGLIKALPEQTALRLAQFVVTRCFLVVVATPDLDAAYRIFSVLNSRGLELTATDILKAELIGGVPKSQRTEYTKKWEDAEECLGRAGFNDLFSHLRMIYRKAKPQGTLLKEFRDHVLQGSNPVTFVDDVLLPMVNAYVEIVDAAYAGAALVTEINESLKWLNRLEFTDWLPPSLAFATRHRANPQRMCGFFANVERLAYAMLIRKAGINERIERFSKLTEEIERNEDTLVNASTLQLTPGEQWEVYGRLDGQIYETLSARARSTILLRLDALLSGGDASYRFGSVTVEHVLPQNPAADSKWVQWFPEARERDHWVHRLGNLALLTQRKNSSASNYEFDKKKLMYFSRGGVSPFALTTQVLQFQEWRPKIIEKRHQELLAVLETHWRLHERADPLIALGLQTA